MPSIENTHLVIQGPILSWSPKSKLDGQFSSVAVIKKSIVDASSKFKTIQIVTWMGQPVSKIREFMTDGKFKNVYLHELQDPGRGRDWKGRLPDNRLRQYYSTLMGLREAQKGASPGDLAIKVRTDQSLDLELLNRDMQSALATDIDAIVFPFANPNDMYSVGDFYLGGTLEKLSEYFQFLIDNLSLPVGSRSVHVDLTQKYLLFSKAATSLETLRFALAGKAARRNGLVPLERKEIEIWAGYISSIFRFFSRDCLDAVQWRSEDLGSRRDFLF